MDKPTLQQIADKMVAPEYRQTLKTAEQMCAAHGWGDADAPTCCGQRVKVTSMIGDPYFAECKTCRKFGAAIDAPMFGNSSVQFFDTDKVADPDAPARWVIGTRSAEEAA